MKLIEITKEEEFSISGIFTIKNIKGKNYILTESNSVNVDKHEPFKGFGDDKDVVYLYWDYCENSIRKHVYYYYSLIDNCVLALIDDDNYQTGVENNKPKYMSNMQHIRLLKYIAVLDNL